MYPRRLGAWRWEAVPSLRPVNTERAETRRKYETGGTRLSRPMGGRTPTGCGRDKYETGGTRLSRPMGGRTPTGCGRDKRGPPVCLTCMTIRSFPVPLQWVKQRVSQPQNPSPCPRDSARSVLTGRRPRDVPAPPRRVALWGGTEPPAGQHGARGGTEEIRNGRDALVASDGGTDADGVRPRQARPSRVLDLYDNPIISRPSPVGEAAREPTSKPISVSP